MDLNKKILKRVLAGTLATASILPITKAEEDVNVPNSENIVIEETEKNGKTESKSWFEANKKNLGIGAVAAAVATFVGVGLCKLFSGSEEKSSQAEQPKQKEELSQAEQPEQKEEPSQAEQPKQQNFDTNRRKKFDSKNSTKAGRLPVLEDKGHIKDFVGCIYGMKNVKEALRQHKNDNWLISNIQLRSLVSLIDVIDGKIICEDGLLKAWCSGVVNGNFDFSGNGMFNNINSLWNIISPIGGCYFNCLGNVQKGQKINIQNVYHEGTFKGCSLAAVKSFCLQFSSGQGFSIYDRKNKIFENFLEINDIDSGNQYELCSVSYYDLDRDQEIAEPNLCVLLKHDDGNWYRHGQKRVEKVDLEYLVNKAAMSGHSFTYSKK